MHTTDREGFCDEVRCTAAVIISISLTFFAESHQFVLHEEPSKPACNVRCILYVLPVVTRRLSAKEQQQYTSSTEMSKKSLSLSPITRLLFAPRRTTALASGGFPPMLVAFPSSFPALIRS